MNIDDYLSKQLQDGETVVRIVRGHPITLGAPVAFGGVLMLADFFLLAWWFGHHGWGVLGFTVVMAIGVFLIIRGIYVWRHNVLAVTNRRVIDIDQHGFFERNVAEAPYEKIQDVRYTIRGLWPTIFHFGTIILQTAGNTTNLELAAVEHPVELQQLISDLQRQAKADQPGAVSAAELVSVVERLKNELGPEGVSKILRKSPPPRHG